MDVTTLSRWQFGITLNYHFFFVPLTLGLSVLVAIMETLYLARKQEVYKQMAKFWGTLFSHKLCHGSSNWYCPGIPIWYELVRMLPF